MTAAPILIFENVVKRYGALTALAGVSLTLHRGEVVCLIGPSGSGKSTLLRCANALDPLDQGRISFDGHEVRSSEASVRLVRQRMGMVFQNFELFPHLTVLRNVTIGPTTVLKLGHSEADARARKLLAKVGLAGQRDFLSLRSVGRPAATRRHRPGARHGAGADAVRRADLGARSRNWSAKCCAS